MKKFDKKIKYWIIFIILSGITSSYGKAQNIIEETATPSVMENLPGKILITEVNFKSSDSDWVEFAYLSSSNEKINLKGISFQDDKIFKTIENDFYLAPNEYGLLFFKKTDADKAPISYTTREGLTATTEQIIMLDKNHQVLDAVCWVNNKPTSSEIADMKKLYQAKGWSSDDIKSCVDSQKVKNGESIIRLNSLDTNTKDDWSMTDRPTPGKENNLHITDKESAQKLPVKTSTPSTALINENKNTSEVRTPIETKHETTIPKETEQQIEEKTAQEDINVISLATIAPPPLPASSPKFPATKTKKSKATKQKPSKSSYSNGDLSNEVIISEFMPNPEKNDSKNEWIELTNKGQKQINLGNWQLDDIEGGSKPYTFSDKTIIEGGKALLIPIAESKIALGNKEDSVRLINFKGEVIDKISYEEAPKQQSYARIILEKENGDKEETWRWVKEATPGAINPLYKELTATIQNEPDFQNYSFEIKTAKNEAKTIFFSEGIVPGPIAKTSFIKGAVIKLILSQKDQKYYLESYEIMSSPSPQADANFIPYLAAIILIFGVSLFIWYRKKTDSKNK